MEKRIMDYDEFVELFNSHFESLMGYAYGYVQDEDIAKDIVHDAYFSLWNNRKKLKSNQYLKSFLYTLTKNYSLNFLKHERVKLSNEFAIQEYINLIEKEEVEDDYLIKLEKLKEKLNELPDKQKEVLMMCFVEGKSYKEISIELDISLNTVKTHLKRAMKFLRGELGSEMILILIRYSRD